MKQTINKLLKEYEIEFSAARCRCEQLAKNYFSVLSDILCDSYNNGIYAIPYDKLILKAALKEVGYESLEDYIEDGWFLADKDFTIIEKSTFKDGDYLRIEMR